MVSPDEPSFIFPDKDTEIHLSMFFSFDTSNGFQLLQSCFLQVNDFNIDLDGSFSISDHIKLFIFVTKFYLCDFSHATPFT